MCTTYHPHTDGKTERTIRTMEDILRACIIKFRGSCDDYLPLVEFAYNNSNHDSIQMAPYEDLYGAPCRTPTCWSEAGEKPLAKLDMVEETDAKIKEIGENIKVSQLRQKQYVDKNVGNR